MDSRRRSLTLVKTWSSMGKSHGCRNLAQFTAALISTGTAPARPTFHHQPFASAPRPPRASHTAATSTAAAQANPAVARQNRAPSVKPPVARTRASVGRCSTPSRAWAEPIVIGIAQAYASWNTQGTDPR